MQNHLLSSAFDSS